MAGNGVSGGSVPASTWFAMMKPLKQGQPDTFFRPASPTYIKGAINMQVPNVVGKNIDEAKTTITAAGFTVAVDTQQNTGAAANVVVDQNPKTTAVPGGTITLIISAGR
jgi:hypothetical protein